MLPKKVVLFLLFLIMTTAVFGGAIDKIYEKIRSGSYEDMYYVPESIEKEYLNYISTHKLDVDHPVEEWHFRLQGKEYEIRRLTPSSAKAILAVYENGEPILDEKKAGWIVNLWMIKRFFYVPKANEDLQMIVKLLNKMKNLGAIYTAVDAAHMATKYTAKIMVTLKKPDSKKVDVISDLIKAALDSYYKAVRFIYTNSLLEDFRELTKEALKILEKPENEITEEELIFLGTYMSNFPMLKRELKNTLDEMYALDRSVFRQAVDIVNDIISVLGVESVVDKISRKLPFVGEVKVTKKEAEVMKRLAGDVYNLSYAIHSGDRTGMVNSLALLLFDLMAQVVPGGSISNEYIQDLIEKAVDSYGREKLKTTGDYIEIVGKVLTDISIMQKIFSSDLSEIAIPKFKVNANYGVKYGVMYLKEKLKESGIIWKRSLEGIPLSVVVTPEGEYVVAGLRGDEESENVNAWIMKLDDTGDTIWQKEYEWNEDMDGRTAFSMAMTPDGGYVLVGYTELDNDDEGKANSGADYKIVKLDKNGDVIWQKILGGSKDDFAGSVAVTPDGEYIIAGVTESNDGDVSGNHGKTDIWVVKLDSNGNIVWQKCLGGSGYDGLATDYDIPIGVNVTPDGGYIVVGTTGSNDGDVSGNHGEADVWVVKLGKDGNIMWQRTLGGSFSDGARSVVVTPDGGYIIAGVTESDDGDVSGNHGDFDFWVLKLDKDGNIMWQKCLGGVFQDGVVDYGDFLSVYIATAPDGGYIIAGVTYTECNSSGIWIIKLDSEGNVLYQKYFGTCDEYDMVTSLAVSQDGNCVITGISESEDLKKWILKFECKGKATVRTPILPLNKWRRCLGGSDVDEAYSVSVTPDGGYIVVGGTTSNDGDVSENHGEADFWVVKLDREGEIGKEAEEFSVPDAFIVVASNIRALVDQIRLDLLLNGTATLISGHVEINGEILEKVDVSAYINLPDSENYEAGIKDNGDSYTIVSAYKGTDVPFNKVESKLSGCKKKGTTSDSVYCEITIPKFSF